MTSVTVGWPAAPRELSLASFAQVSRSAVVRGDPQMRRAALQHFENRGDDAAHSSQLGRRATVEGRCRREEVAEELVRAVDQMDDHGGHDTAGS
jgi:hypothetical protein